MRSIVRSLTDTEGGEMPWREVAITMVAIMVPPVVAVWFFGRVGAVGFVAALPAYLAAKDDGIKVAALVTLTMGMAGLLALDNPAMALIVGPIIGVMTGICGTWGLARPCIRAAITWTIFTSPIIDGSNPPFLFLIFALSMLWALWVAWQFGQTCTSGDEAHESEEYAVIFGVMMALGMGISVWVGREFFGPHGFWFPLTFVVLILPPHGQLFGRTVKRTVGTVIGAAIALALARLTVDPLVVGLIGAVTMTLGFRYLPSSYTLFTVFLTVAVIEILALVAEVDRLAYERVGTMIAAALMTLALAAMGWIGLRLFRPEALEALKEDAGDDEDREDSRSSP